MYKSKKMTTFLIFYVKGIQGSILPTSKRTEEIIFLLLESSGEFSFWCLSGTDADCIPLVILIIDSPIRSIIHYFFPYHSRRSNASDGVRNSVAWGGDYVQSLELLQEKILDKKEYISGRLKVGSLEQFASSEE